MFSCRYGNVMKHFYAKASIRFKPQTTFCIIKPDPEVTKQFHAQLS